MGYSEHGVTLAPLFPCFPPSPALRAWKERRKDRKEDGWDGMGWDVCSIVFPLLLLVL
jgi:hypothetical protein